MRYFGVVPIVSTQCRRHQSVANGRGGEEEEYKEGKEKKEEFPSML